MQIWHVVMFIPSLWVGCSASYQFRRFAAIRSLH